MSQYTIDNNIEKSVELSSLHLLFHYFRHSYDEVQKIKEFLFNKTAFRPTVGIVCGSGLGGLVNNVENKEIFNYADVPGFPISTGKGNIQNKTN